MEGYLFKSERLGFRKWRSSDLAPFAQMNADSEVMEFFPAVMSPQETQQMIERIQAQFDRQGYGLYAVDQLATRSFIGFIGFIYQEFEAFFTPCVEIGWRLRRAAWNQGFATEGAERCLAYGFEALNFQEVYSITALPNKKSERIMQKIGMAKAGEFEHPKIADGHWLKRHVLYKKENSVL